MTGLFADILAQFPNGPKGWNDLYNTPLNPEQEKAYQKWLTPLAAARGWDKDNATHDYDLQGYFLKYGGTSPTGDTHFTDEFKKPNHPTFSTESKYSGVNGNIGGQWEQGQDGKWSFTASPTNLKMRSLSDLQNYFSKYEPDSKLIVPQIQTQNPDTAPDYFTQRLNALKKYEPDSKLIVPQVQTQNPGTALDYFTQRLNALKN